MPEPRSAAATSSILIDRRITDDHELIRATLPIYDALLAFLA